MKLAKNKIILNDIKPSVGIANWYNKQLVALVFDIKNDVNQIISKQFKPEAKKEKKAFAMDGASDGFMTAIALLKGIWVKRINKQADKIAKRFLEQTLKSYDANLKAQLSKNNLSISFSITDYQKAQYEAVINENIALIRSIPERYLSQVETVVNQCVTTGYRLSELSKSLQKQYMITKRRANFIARDQANKAHAITEQARRKELGISSAIWLHSGRGREPRESHLKANGKVYEVDKGMMIDGKYTMPGMEINCKCTSRSIIEF